MNSDGEISFGFPFCQMDGPSTASVMNTCQVPCVLFPPLHPFFRSSDSPQMRPVKQTLLFGGCGFLRSAAKAFLDEAARAAEKLKIVYASVCVQFQTH